MKDLERFNVSSVDGKQKKAENLYSLKFIIIIII